MSEENKGTPTPNEGEHKSKENEGGEEKDPKSLEAQKEHFRTKYENTQKEFEEYKAKHPEKDPEPTPPQDPNFKPNEGNDQLAKDVAQIKFTQANPNLPPAVVQEALDQAEFRGITPEEALELPTVKAFAEVELAKAATENAMPKGGGRSPKMKPDEMPTTPEEHEAWAKKHFNLK